MRSVRLLASLLLLCVAASCASTQEADSTGTQRVVNVTVVNNLIPPSPVEIYLVPRSGIERMLGRVQSGTATVQYKGLALSGEYQLVAKPLSGNSYYSPVILLENVRAIHWDLMRNFLDITTGE